MTQICNNHINLDLNLANSINFWSLEVLDRGSETQLEVVEHFKLLVQRSKWYVMSMYVGMGYVDTTTGEGLNN